MSQFDLPTQYQLKNITIDGQDVAGLFQSLDYYESIFIPAVGGTLTLLDSTGAGFIEEYGIEWIEDIEFTASNADGDTLQFKGVLNGLRNETVKQQLKLYVCDFTSKEVRKNEQVFIEKAFEKKNPKNIVSEMVEKIGGKTDKMQGSGEPMTFVGNRRRPTDIIKYVLTHGVASKASTEKANNNDGKPKQVKSKGTTGFLCWQTQKGYRFDTIDNIMKGSSGEQHQDYKYQMQNIGSSISEMMKGIIDMRFPQIGDFQSHQRGGAFKNKVVSMDLDTGVYVEQEYKDEANATSKQKQESEECTRWMNKPFQNERFEMSCNKAQENTGDQSRRYLSQNAARQNTAVDQFGVFTIPPALKMKAGDSFDCKISRVQGEEGSGSGGYDRKHSGKYVIYQVGHHFRARGDGYTKISTMRSTTQQDDSSS